jgi:hypothetical protein
VRANVDRRPGGVERRIAGGGDERPAIQDDWRERERGDPS